MYVREEKFMFILWFFVTSKFPFHPIKKIMENRQYRRKQRKYRRKFKEWIKWDHFLAFSSFHFSLQKKTYITSFFSSIVLFVACLRYLNTLFCSTSSIFVSKLNPRGRILIHTKNYTHWKKATKDKNSDRVFYTEFFSGSILINDVQIVMT